jgi:hypothetical protein
MPLYKADHSGISSPLFQRFLPRSGTWALRRQPVLWTAVLVLWKFFILVAFVASKAAEICLLVYTDKALILYVVVELVLSTQLLHLPKSRLATFKKKKKKKNPQFVAGTLESYLLSLLSVG